MQRTAFCEKKIEGIFHLFLVKIPPRLLHSVSVKNLKNGLFDVVVNGAVSLEGFTARLMARH